MGASSVGVALRRVVRLVVSVGARGGRVATARQHRGSQAGLKCGLPAQRIAMRRRQRGELIRDRLPPGRQRGVRGFRGFRGFGGFRGVGLCRFVVHGR